MRAEKAISYLCAEIAKIAQR